MSARRYPSISREQSGLWLGLITLRVVAVTLCAAVLLQAAKFNDAGNPVRATYEAAGVKWAWWYQKLNYQQNGVVAGFLYNTQVPAMKKPPGYSAARMAQIAKRYAAIANRMNNTRDPDLLRDVNIVLVLSEAFSDPTRVAGAQFATDPIPFSRKLMTRTTSGRMLAQLVGGGTASMEFEALTGMSLGLFEPQMTSPFQMLLPSEPAFPSSLRYLRTLGHHAVALHPYLTTMYQRERAYPSLGFQDFVGAARMSHADKLESGEFISDAAAFDEVVEIIQGTGQPVVAHLVTMQNHYPTDGIYENPIPVQGLDGTRAALAEGYARGPHYTDQALKKFIRALEVDDEKTVIVFFGDHLPGFWPDEIIAQNGLTMRETPFLMWSNFTNLSPQDTPIVSPVHFLPMLFQSINAPSPPYYVLLDELRRHIPAMGQGLLIDALGAEVHESALSPIAARVLEDYRLVQYDLSVGSRYSLDAMLPQTLDARTRSEQ